MHAHPQFAANQSLTDAVRAAIQQHREIWVTEADFQLLNATGFNAVRLPVGYWVLATEQVPSPCTLPSASVTGTGLRQTEQAEHAFSHQWDPCTTYNKRLQRPIRVHGARYALKMAIITRLLSCSHVSYCRRIAPSRQSTLIARPQRWGVTVPL